jgi:hypothetical protein
VCAKIPKISKNSKRLKIFQKTQKIQKITKNLKTFKNLKKTHVNDKESKNLYKIPKILKFHKTKSTKKSIFPLEFEKSKNCRNDRGWLNSDVTFRSDTFSYKKLFNLTSYAKVIAVLL